MQSNVQAKLLKHNFTNLMNMKSERDILSQHLRETQRLLSDSKAEIQRLENERRKYSLDLNMKTHSTKEVEVLESKLALQTVLAKEYAESHLKLAALEKKMEENNKGHEKKIKMLNDAHVKSIQNTKVNTMKELGASHSQQLNMLTVANDKKMHEQQVSYETKLQDMETSHGQSKNALIATYETKLQDMETSHGQSKNALIATYEAKLQDMESSHSQSKNALIATYEAKLHAEKLVHDRDRHALEKQLHTSKDNERQVKLTQSTLVQSHNVQITDMETRMFDLSQMLESKSKALEQLQNDVDELNKKDNGISLLEKTLSDKDAELTRTLQLLTTQQNMVSVLNRDKQLLEKTRYDLTIKIKELESKLRQH